jgi:hypothetical protein
VDRAWPPAGYITKRLAEEWLRATLDEARRGVLPGMVRTGATFADAAAEYLRYIGEDRVRKASTVDDYRSIIRVHLLPAFGETAVEALTPADVEAFAAELGEGHATYSRVRLSSLGLLLPDGYLIDAAGAPTLPGRSRAGACCSP